LWGLEIVVSKICVLEDGEQPSVFGRHLRRISLETSSPQVVGFLAQLAMDMELRMMLKLSQYVKIFL
jgi:hypothetical protein